MSLLPNPSGGSYNPTVGNPVLYPAGYEHLDPKNLSADQVPLSVNNMDTPEHKALYEKGLEIRRKVVGEDYVENALEKGKSDFLRPLQQFATVFPPFSLCPCMLYRVSCSFECDSGGEIMTDKAVGISLGHNRMSTLGRCFNFYDILILSVVDAPRFGIEDPVIAKSRDVDCTGKMGRIGHSRQRCGSEWSK
jgi:hypothetical protein